MTTKRQYDARSIVVRALGGPYLCFHIDHVEVTRDPQLRERTFRIRIVDLRRKDRFLFSDVRVTDKDLDACRAPTEMLRSKIEGQMDDEIGLPDCCLLTWSDEVMA